MTLRDIITGLFLLATLTAPIGFHWCVIRAILAVLIGFLWCVIRWGVISESRLRGWKSRLARPRLEEVEAKWGVRLPRVLEEFYRSGIAERVEFYLVPLGADRTRRWFIHSFIPLTARDITEWIPGTMLPGIPIAIDGNKGFYYLPFDALRGGGSCPVLHRDLGASWPFTDTEVAPSVEDFVRFQAVEPPCEEDEGVADPV